MMQLWIYNHLPSLVKGQHYVFEVGASEQIRTSLANPCGSRGMVAEEERPCYQNWTLASNLQGYLRRPSDRQEQIWSPASSWSALSACAISCHRELKRGTVGTYMSAQTQTGKRIRSRVVSQHMSLYTNRQHLLTHSAHVSLLFSSQAPRGNCAC